jgi:hypothetical protein
MTNTTLREWVGQPETHTVHDHRLIPLLDCKLRENVELQRHKRLARPYAAGVALRPLVKHAPRSNFRNYVE